MTMQKIHIGGDFFVNEDGSEFHYVGLSDFALPKRIQMTDGPEALVRPVIIERRSIADKAGYTGPIVLRCMKYGHPNNPFGCSPWYDFQKLNDLAHMAAEYNCYIDFTTADNQYVLPNQADQQRHQNESCSAITVFHFDETCNEPFKNGIDVNVVKPPSTGMNLRDSGMYYEIGGPDGGWRESTILDYVSGHFTRSRDMDPRFPKWLIDMNDQLAVMRSHLRRASVLKEPIGWGDPSHPSGRFNDPYLAKLMGQVASYGGIVFHSTVGVSSDGWDESTKNGAFAFFTGVANALR